MVQEFLDFISGKRLIIHNAEFDLSHLNNELKIIGKEKLKNEIVPKIVPSERIKVNETAIDTCNQLSLAYLLLSIFLSLF